MRIRIRGLRYKIMAIFLSIYAFTRGGIGLMISTSYWTIGLLIILMLSIFCMYKKSLFVISKRDIPIILMIMEIILWNNWDFKNNEWFLDLILVVFFFFLLAANKTDVWFDVALSMILVMGVFHAIWTIICFLSPNIYYTIVYPIVNNIAQWSLTAMYDKGFMTGFNYSNSQDAIYLTSGIIICVCSLLFSNKAHKIKWLHVTVLFFLLFSLLLTGKRGPIVWFSVAFVIVYWLYNCDKPSSRIFKVFSIVVFTIAIIYFMSFFIPEVLNFVYRFIEMAEQGDISTHRTELWGMGFDAFLRSPLLGHGWFWFKYNNSFGITYHVHNCYIQLLCELGLIGAIPWFYFLVINFKHTVTIIRGIKKGELCDYNGKVLRQLMFSAFYQMYFLIYAFAGTSFYEPECLLPYIFSSAIAMYYWDCLKKGKMREGALK